MNVRVSERIQPSDFVSILRELAQTRPVDTALIVVN